MVKILKPRRDEKFEGLFSEETSEIYTRSRVSTINFFQGVLEIGFCIIIVLRTGRQQLNYW